jgi:AcrR family transcriptional regulator
MNEADGPVAGRRAPTGLRQRKKQRLRESISSIATRLFVERGFDAVTVAEIARAADIAENTVFNYFPTKEDLFFDLRADIEAHFSQVVRARGPGESVVDALRRDFLEALDRAGPRVGPSHGMVAFWRVVDASPALQARMLSMGQRATQRLADELLVQGLADDDPALAGSLASLVTAVPWALQTEIRRRLTAGEPLESVHAALRPVAIRAFDLLRHGIGDLGAPPGGQVHVSPDLGGAPTPEQASSTHAEPAHPEPRHDR